MKPLHEERWQYNPHTGYVKTVEIEADNPKRGLTYICELSGGGLWRDRYGPLLAKAPELLQVVKELAEHDVAEFIREDLQQLVAEAEHGLVLTEQHVAELHREGEGSS